MSLDLSLEKNAFLPKESILTTVKLENLTENKIQIYNLDAHSVVFYLLNKATGEPLEVMPVFSEKEPLLEIGELEPYGKLERKFLFCAATGQKGDFSLQASYQLSSLKGKTRYPNVISMAQDFRVDGQALYERDKKGILLKDNAIDIAKKRLGKPVRDAWAKLVINEAGFYDWWINLVLEEMDPNGNPLNKAYFVNPYLATVRKEALPFPKPREEQDEPIVPYKAKDKLSENLNLNPLIPSDSQKSEKKN
ncbi:hypothetical protein JW926_05565 [Candidatus Sumerlaeota bacterium]|nr:hypothetical protein [Candidatus Sumerlaeota bacterium]